jgi:hypothetical protein
MFPFAINPYTPDGVNVGEEFSDRAVFPTILVYLGREDCEKAVLPWG